MAKEPSFMAPTFTALATPLAPRISWCAEVFLNELLFSSSSFVFCVFWLFSFQCVFVSFPFSFFHKGAGKTTTFSMLTGELGITGGTAYLGGVNIQQHLREVCTTVMDSYALSYVESLTCSGCRTSSIQPPGAYLFFVVLEETY